MAPYNLPLLIGAGLSLGVALLHFACIVWGAPGFRFLGAGEPLIRLAAAGHGYPPFIAGALGAVFTSRSLYPLSGARVMAPLPYLKLALAGITAVYLARAVAVPWLKPAFPDNSTAFWVLSSAMCGVIGGLHLLGLVPVWRRA